MGRTRHVNIDADYPLAELGPALRQVRDFTAAIAPIMERLTPEQRRAFWTRNQRSRQIGRALRQINQDTSLFGRTE